MLKKKTPTFPPLGESGFVSGFPGFGACSAHGDVGFAVEMSPPFSVWFYTINEVEMQ
jgi:hypothetical protein